MAALIFNILDKVDCTIEFDEKPPVDVIIMLFDVFTDSTNVKPVEVIAVKILAFKAVNKDDIDK